MNMRQKWVVAFWDKINPRKSLKNTLSLWFILFATLPLLIVVSYSAYFLSQRINDELVKRLTAFEQGIDIELHQVEERLLMGSFGHANDYYLVKLLQNDRITQLQSVTQNLIENYIVDRVSYFSSDGKLLTSVSPKKTAQNPEIVLPEENNLPLDIIKKLTDQRQIIIKSTHSGIGLVFDCITLMKFAKKTVGFIKETLILDRSYSLNTKERTGLDIALLDSQFKLLVSSLELDQEKTFLYPSLKKYRPISSLDLLNDSYLMLTKPFLDTEEKTVGYLSILVSQASTQQTLNEIRNIFILLFLGSIGVIIFFSQIASRTILRPINLLLGAIKNIEKGTLDQSIPVPPMEEIAMVINSFNTMSSSLADTQTQLVHSSKMVSLGQLVAGVAHELNNPIGYTYSNLSHLNEYLEKIKSWPKQNNKEVDFILKDMESIIQSSLEGIQRTKDIVQGLRNFSRLDEAEIKEVDLHEGLESTLKLLNSEIKNKITVHKDYGNIPKILCYPSQINQVFMNILSNSIQAIEGAGEIWIKTGTKNDALFISIRDSGKGIKPEHLSRIFDPFFTTKKIGKGTGLGLSISYGIIQKHNGEITVKSEVNKGSTFTITLSTSGLSSQN